VEHPVRVPGLDPRHAGLRIAHLSDLHAGRYTPARHLRRVVELVNQAGVDLVCMTGDYVSWHREEISAMTEILSGLRPRPVFATLGNHDHVVSGARVADALRGCGFEVLRNQHRSAELRGASLHIVGIDDPVTRRHDLAAAFQTVPEQGTRLVLCHCPERADEIAERGAHLILSGHTHAGQIVIRGLTHRLLARLGKRYLGGFYQIGTSRLFVNAGVGFSALRIRFGAAARAEVAVLTLQP
jgi:hypothetical protein